MAKEEKGEDHEELKKAYDKAKEKYSLIPTFEELDSEFEITLIDPDRTHFIVKDVKNAICAKLHKILDYISPIINPSPSSLHSMIEIKFFEKDEVDKIFIFYKKIHHLLHKAILQSLETEKDEADFVNEIWKQWPQIKREIKIYVSKITEGWAREEKERDREEYLG